MSEKLEPPDRAARARAKGERILKDPQEAFWANYQAALVDEQEASGMTDAEVCERLLIAEMLKRES